MSEVADKFIQAFMAGQQSRLAQEEHEQRMADSKLQQDMLKHHVDRMKLEDQIAARTLAIQTAQLQQGQPARVLTPAADLGTGITPTAEIPAQYPSPPVQSAVDISPQSAADIPATGVFPSDNLQSPDLQTVLANRQVQLQGSPTPAVLERTTMPHEPVTIPGVEAFNGAPATPEVSITPQTQEELRAQAIQDLMMKLRAERAANTYQVTLPGGQTVTLPKEGIGPTITGEYAAQRDANPKGELQEFRDVYYPGYLAKNNLRASPAAALDAFKEFFQTKKQQLPRPGVDVPFPADVQAQRVAAGAARFSSSGADLDETVNAIAEGKAVPTLQAYSFRDRTAIAAGLHRAGYNQAVAERDWKAINRHLSTLNGQQQERLRQTITFAYDSLDIIEELYNDWQKTRLPGGFKSYNKAALNAAANLPGDAGSKAQALITQINDLTSELGTVYKGGNSSTDESLKLAAENLKAEWNDETFKRNLSLVRKNLQIRRNSIITSEAAGVSPKSPYQPPANLGSAAGTIRLQAPDGSIRDVPVDQADHYIQLGARRIK